MTIYITKAAIDSLKKLQDVTTVLTKKPALPERWIRLEIPEDNNEQQATPQVKT